MENKIKIRRNKEKNKVYHLQFIFLLIPPFCMVASSSKSVDIIHFSTNSYLTNIIPEYLNYEV